MEGIYLNLIKVMKSILPEPYHIEWGTLKAFLLKSAIRQKCPLSPLLLNIVLKLARVIST